MYDTAKDIPAELRPALVDALLAMADDKFFLGHRNGDWTGLGPFLEADIAFSNIAQDEIAHAQELYRLVAALEGRTNENDAVTNELAYARPADRRLCCAFVLEADSFDWAVAVCRQCFFDHYDALRMRTLCASAFKPLAALAGKMAQEIQFHVTHFDDWLVKLGTGTAESRAKLAAAVTQLWADIPGLLAGVEGQDRLVDASVLPACDPPMHVAFGAVVVDLLKRCGVTPPPAVGSAAGVRRAGDNAASVGAVLEEISEVYEGEPGVQW